MKKGWYLVQVDGYSIGWGKWSGQIEKSLSERFAVDRDARAERSSRLRDAPGAVAASGRAFWAEKWNCFDNCVFTGFVF